MGWTALVMASLLTGDSARRPTSMWVPGVKNRVSGAENGNRSQSSTLRSTMRAKVGQLFSELLGLGSVFFKPARWVMSSGSTEAVPQRLIPC